MYSAMELRVSLTNLLAETRPFWYPTIVRRHSSKSERKWNSLSYKVIHNHKFRICKSKTWNYTGVNRPCFQLLWAFQLLVYYMDVGTKSCTDRLKFNTKRYLIFGQNCSANSNLLNIKLVIDWFKFCFVLSDVTKQ